jgi:hypothetical protein
LLPVTTAPGEFDRVTRLVNERDCFTFGMDFTAGPVVIVA